MRLVELLFRADRRAAYRRARRYEQERLARAMPSIDEAYARVSRQLGTGAGVPMGGLPNGDTVHLDDRVAMRSGLLIGASGSGKTRFILGYLQHYLECIFSTDATDLELELVDPKQETFDLLAQHLAARWLRGDESVRQRIEETVRVIDWSADAVAPIAPFDNSNGEVSNTYLAYIRTDVAIQASPQPFSEPLRQAYFMLNRALVDLRFPPNYAFTARFFGDETYRGRILERVSDADVRAYFANFDHTMPRQTREALLRRIQADLAFPQVRLATGIPPASLDKLMPTRKQPIVLGNYGCTLALPLAKAKERASYRLIDVLLAAPRRDAQIPATIVIEESPMLLAGSSELAEPLAEGARTLRSAGVGLIFVAQDFANALPASMVRMLQLNTRWWAVFESRAEAEWLYPHLVQSANERREPERDRHRAFLRRMQNLPRGQYYLLVKGHPALPLRARHVPDPGAAARESAERLREIFRVNIAMHSLLSAKIAEEEIAAWEAAVLSGQTETAAPSKRQPGGRTRGLRALVDQLEADRDEEHD